MGRRQSKCEKVVETKKKLPTRHIRVEQKKNLKIISDNKTKNRNNFITGMVKRFYSMHFPQMRNKKKT